MHGVDWYAVALFVVIFELLHRYGVAATLRLIWRFFADMGPRDSAERARHRRWRAYGERN